MKLTSPKSIVTAAVAMFLLVGAAHAVPAPYTPDADTLHLWHFDETAGNALPDPGLSSSFELVPQSSATVGATGFAGFGGAGDTSANDTSGFQGNTIPVGDLTGADGAFTFEAVINISNTTAGQQIIAMDANGANSGRPFQFRIDSAVTPTGNLRFINIGGAAIEQFTTAIPTTGDHAFMSDEWFHVAVTYDGNDNTADNLKFYWTALNSGATVANLLDSQTMVTDLNGTATLGVGSEYRGPASQNLEGFLDEVRISGIARAANDFVLTGAPVPEPTTATLALLGLGGLAMRRRRNAAGNAADTLARC